MVQMTITLSGVKQTSASFRNYAVNIPKSIRRGTYKFAEYLATVSRAEAPKGATKYMSSKRGTKVKGNKKSDEWQIVMPYYTKYVEEGTSAHWIPRMSKTVNWARMHGFTFYYFNNLVAAKGTEGHPFTARVVKREIRQLNRMLRKNVRRGIKQSKR